MKLIIVIPAFNEELIIRQNVLKVLDFLKNQMLEYDWQIVVSDNNSKDRTREIVRALSQEYKQIEYLFVEQQGKGAAIRSAWEKFEADIYCFMDADLATNLDALPTLISKIANENYDMTYGSRYAKDSKIERNFIRTLFSYGYRLIAKFFLRLKVSDLPCGFKAINKKVRDNILSKIKNTEWFFDSELIILTEKLGYKVGAVAIKWREPVETGRSSKVKIFSLSWEYFKKILELRKRLKDNNQ